LPNLKKHLKGRTFSSIEGHISCGWEVCSTTKRILEWVKEVRTTNLLVELRGICRVNTFFLFNSVACFPYRANTYQTPLYMSYVIGEIYVEAESIKHYFYSIFTLIVPGANAGIIGH
jgi:hypothetical protein